MNHIIRILLLSFAALASLFTTNSYASNAELEALRHSHLAKSWRHY